ncbi:von Willebrand factor C and EGF domain-containing protein-like [Eriocheir sinensis]|uniref:von Willebrand factor C and EGF domain-containing protein-like n=1 Tax=Eriocheir sinensis TaxID=95602 RepID=UPI0021CA5CA8|nr:von Willebrand factor C and EGF domain-containing protein-like [Eriocheir sinensis]
MEEAVKAVEGTRRRWGDVEGGTSSTTSSSTTTVSTTSTSDSTFIYPPAAKGCLQDGAMFAEGSAMMSPDECSYCFCIHGSRQCVAPKCLLPVEGCRPRYRTFSCCPSFYDCRE